MNNHDRIKHRTKLARLHPSAFLLAAQLLSLILYAAFDKSSIGRALLGAFGILVLALVFWVILRSRTIRWIAWLLVVPAILLSLLSVLIDNTSLLIAASLMEAVTYFYAAGTLIGYMMEDRRVTSDELFAAGATFTLLAWGYAFAYLACQTWLPGSFISTAFPGSPRTFTEFLSVSFTNLSATGLGDALPISSPARVLVMLEQFSGIAYVAVVVSRLIGMTIGHARNSRTP